MNSKEHFLCKHFILYQQENSASFLKSITDFLALGASGGFIRALPAACLSTGFGFLTPCFRSSLSCLCLGPVKPDHPALNLRSCSHPPSQCQPAAGLRISHAVQIFLINKTILERYLQITSLYRARLLKLFLKKSCLLGLLLEPKIYL